MPGNSPDNNLIERACDTLGKRPILRILVARTVAELQIAVREEDGDDF